MGASWSRDTRSDSPTAKGDCRGQLEVLIAEAESELARAGTWGTTFTLIQVYAQVQDG